MHNHLNFNEKITILSYIQEYMLGRHYALRTTEAYIYGIHQYTLYHDKKHPKSLTSKHVEDFLTHLVVNKKSARKTQSLALNTLVFLYKEINKATKQIEVYNFI